LKKALSRAAALLLLAVAEATPAQPLRSIIEGNEFGGKTVRITNPDGNYVTREDSLYDGAGRLRRKIEQYSISTLKEEPCTLALFEYGEEGTVAKVERFFNIAFIRENEGLFKENLSMDKGRISRRDLWYLDSPVNSKRIKHVVLLYGDDGTIKTGNTERFGDR